ncbi:pilus assembly protein [Montanilutibacter psychrotolerans]|uniref:Pilus assembly protein n=1 Tax=Montanilutibacter psychrotolerans TaxID=1327343 RepID=A0A3M8SY53_9GAMM|nr:PilC/PilY family type IV pilus protein [Lysobacter psychrotolerans]RNF86169.1 pilus assembly protein [Lysobacter psychrotolerans]
MTNNKTRAQQRFPALPLLSACIATVLGLPVHAAMTLPPTPLQFADPVAPNVLFILDDSGSMNWYSMPGSTGTSSEAGLSDSIAMRSSMRNTVYYNPAITYTGWKKVDSAGTVTTLASTPRTAVYSDANLASGSTINLLAQGRDYTFYVYNGGSITTNSSYTRYVLDANGTGSGTDARSCTWDGSSWICNSITTFPFGNTLDSIAEQWTNFANWYSYHSTRMKAAKAGASQAFSELEGAKYRTGFSTIWNGTNGYNSTTQMRIPVGTDDGKFIGNNRATWFNNLHATRANNGTPLLPALTRAGDYFKETGADGPYGGTLDVNNNQLQCRQNFSILTTDGYWNSGSSSVGNTDGTDGVDIARPDGTTDKYVAAAPFSDTNSTTLADVAMYYWKNDLRPDSAMSNIVPTSAKDGAFWQHMVTFGISIGLKGTVDQSSVAQVLADGSPKIGGTNVAWPNPMDAEDDERIDDLLHAAVNGRGEFIAATNPTAFTAGLRDALAAINNQQASRSNLAANSSSINGNTRVYVASYTGGQWTGELAAHSITAPAGTTNPPLFKATIQMPAYTSRQFFTWGTTGTSFPTTAQATALGGTNIVNYLKGDQSLEQGGGTGTYRQRLTVLGDIVHSSPVFVRGMSATGTPDPTRDTIYVGANDGMLHAFNADLTERFAYVPGSTNMTALASLSSPAYVHKWFTDGPLVVSDRLDTKSTTYPNGRDILVGFMGRGGKGLYALDVTSPTTFAATNILWDRSETTSAWSTHANDLGYMVGRPFIAKLNNGKTGVVFGNGVNSTNDTASLFVVDIEDGTILKKISVAGANNAMFTPKGWDNEGDGDIDVVYAGDLRGNMWKFDLSDSNPNQWGNAISGNNPLFSATDSANKAQPIVSVPEIAMDPTTFKRWVFFGTGKFLEATDPGNRDVQTWYGIIDAGANIGARGTNLSLRKLNVAGTGTNGRPVRGFEANKPLDTGKEKGWFIDLLDPASTPPKAEGERMMGVNQERSGVLIASSGIPSDNPCNPTGRGYLYALDAFTGTSLKENYFDLDGDGNFTDDTVGSGGNQVGVGGVDLGVGMVGDPLVQDGLVTVPGSTSGTGSAPVRNTGQIGRISWRELLKD